MFDPVSSITDLIGRVGLSGTDLASCRLQSTSAKGKQPSTSVDMCKSSSDISLACSKAIEANEGYRSLYVGLRSAATPNRSSAVGAYRSISFIYASVHTVIDRSQRGETYLYHVSSPHLDMGVTV